MTDDEAVARLVRLPALVNGDAALVRRGRNLTAEIMIGVGERAVHVSVRDGRIEAVDAAPAPMRSWRFAIRAEAETWSRFWEAVPRPGFNDLMALVRFGRARIEGDLQPLMANLRYVKDVLEAPRRGAGG